MDQTSITLAAALALGALALVLGIAAHRRLATTRRSLAVLQGNVSGRTILEAVSGFAGDLRALADRLEALDRRQQELFALAGRTPRNVGIVRYDAFEDMGGRMSFSAALLDDAGNGLILTSINGRSEARTYAKTIQAGGSDHNLSPEEQEAIARALGQDAGVKARRRR